MGYGFGLGFCGAHGAGDVAGAGLGRRIFLGGVTGTYFWIDPPEQMIVVLMLASPDQRLRYRYLSRQLVYAAATRSRGRLWQVNFSRPIPGSSLWASSRNSARSRRAW